MEEKDCIYCEYFLTESWREKRCYDKENKSCFKVSPVYKSKIICENEVFYNTNHFNRFQKWIAKILYNLKIEDV